MPHLQHMHDLSQNPLLLVEHMAVREKLKARFPVLSNCPHDRFLVVQKYLKRTPHRFFCETTRTRMSHWLDDQARRVEPRLQLYFSQHTASLDSAFRSLESINAHNWHDTVLSGDDPEAIRFVDQRIHPAYLKLIESAMAPLLHPVAYMSRVDRAVKVDGLDVWNIIQELARSPLVDQVGAYRHVIRNAIAHGGVSYIGSDIAYRDRSGASDTFTYREVVRIFDELLDTCNGLALAITLHCIMEQVRGNKLPHELVLQELGEETRAPWWEVEACIPVEHADRRQLNIYAVSNTSDQGKVYISGLQTGIVAALHSPEYDRLFIRIRSQKSLPGWIALNGKKFRQFNVRPPVSIEDCAQVLDDIPMFYRPHVKLPRLLLRFHTLIASIRLHWPNIVAEFRKQLKRPDVIVRNASVHRNGWRRVVRGDVYFEAPGGVPIELSIRNSCRLLMRKSAKAAGQGSLKLRILRFLPLGFGRISVYQRDYRRRRLLGFGLGSDLVCTIQVQSISRIRTLDISGSQIEQCGKYRIAWNRAWLDCND